MANTATVPAEACEFSSLDIIVFFFLIYHFGLNLKWSSIIRSSGIFSYSKPVNQPAYSEIAPIT